MLRCWWHLPPLSLAVSGSTRRDAWRAVELVHPSDWATAYCGFLRSVRSDPPAALGFRPLATDGDCRPSVRATTTNGSWNLSQALGAPADASPRTRLFCWLPFNQLWQLRVAEYESNCRTCRSRSTGCRFATSPICTISPRIERAYFDEVVRLTNAMRSDLVALTGDMCDKADRISTGCPRRWAG